MKKLIITALLSTLGIGAMAQKPEKIYPYNEEQHPMDWYHDQVKAWQKVIKNEPKNAAGWYNLYYANRIILFNDQEDKRTSEQKKAEMEKLFADMEKNVPNSYEYNMVRWLAEGMDMKYLPYLQKARSIAPERTEHLDGMINVSEIQRKNDDKYLYAGKKYNAGKLSAGMMYYNYNVLTSLEPNAIILTTGDNDTYPVWVLQSMGIRKDVYVLNLSLIQIDEYREKLFKELGIDNWDMQWGTTSEDYKAAMCRFRKSILKHIAKNNDHPVYLSLTASELADTDTVAQEDLYLVGLAYKYSKEPVDNMALMKKNFEQLYALDYLDKTFYKDISPDMVSYINWNYIVPMLKLYDHYKIAGEPQRQAWIEKKLLTISKGLPDEESVRKHLAR